MVKQRPGAVLGPCLLGQRVRKAGNQQINGVCQALEPAIRNTLLFFSLGGRRSVLVGGIRLIGLGFARQAC